MKRIFETNPTKHGRGPIKFQWQKKSSNFLAVVGSTNTLNIYDKHSDLMETIPLLGACISLDWSPDGEVLAIIVEKSSAILLWDSVNRKMLPQLESSLKNLNSLSWSNNGDKVKRT